MFSSISSIIFFIIFKLRCLPLIQQDLNFVLKMAIIFSHGLSWGEYGEIVIHLMPAFSLKILMSVFVWTEELSKVKHAGFVLPTTLLRLFDKSPRSQVKIFVFIDFDYAIIASTLYFDNATQNDMVHELGFIVINALVFIGLQL